MSAKRLALLIAMVILISSSLVCYTYFDSINPKPNASPVVRVTETQHPIATPSHVQDTADPTASPTESPEPDRFLSINHYTLGLERRSELDEEGVTYYEKLVDGIMQQQEVVTLTDNFDENLFYWYVLQANPYYFLVKDADISDDHTAMEFTYVYDPDTQAEVVRYIDNEYLFLLNKVIPKVSYDLEKVLTVYRYFSSRISYDYDWLAQRNESEDKFLVPEIDIYRALNTSSGVCHSYTYLCEFALNLLGIDCFAIMGYDTNAEDNHMWLLVKIGEFFYHCDPTWDKGEGNNVGLRYFGMTDKRREETGIVLSGIYTDLLERVSGIKSTDDNGSEDNNESFDESSDESFDESSDESSDKNSDESSGESSDEGSGESAEEQSVYKSLTSDETFAALWNTINFEFGDNHTITLYDESGQSQVFSTLSKSIIG